MQMEKETGYEDTLKDISNYIKFLKEQINISEQNCKSLLNALAEKEVENKCLQDRNDELRAELEAFKNDRAS